MHGTLNMRGVKPYFAGGITMPPPTPPDDFDPSELDSGIATETPAERKRKREEALLAASLPLGGGAMGADPGPRATDAGPESASTMAPPTPPSVGAPMPPAMPPQVGGPPPDPERMMMADSAGGGISPGPPTSPPDEAIGRNPAFRARLIGQQEGKDEAAMNTSPQTDLQRANADYMATAGKYTAQAGKKIPWWQTALQVAITRDPRLLTQSGKLATLQRQLEAQGKVTEEERKVQTSAEQTRLHEKQIDLTDEQKRLAAAQRLSALKPALTPLDRYRQAKEIPGVTDDQVIEFALNGKVKETPEKPDTFGTVSAGGSVFNKSTGTISGTAPAKEVPDKETVNQWIADSLSPDPTVSEPAKQKITAWEKTQKNQRPPIVNVNAIPSDPAVEQAAVRYLKTGELPSLGMGRDAATARTKILNRAAELDPEADIAGAKAGYKADADSLRSLQKTEDAINAFEGTARKNLKQFMDVAQKTIDTGMPWANSIFRGGARQLGDQNAAKFEAARTVAFTEIAKVLNNPTSNALLSDSARREAQTILSGDYTLKQLQGVAQLLIQDMENRKTETARARSEIQQRIKGGSKGSAGTADPLGIR